MKIDLTNPNPALKSVFADPSQMITLDANLLIPPDRSSLGAKDIPFKAFRQIWLDPLFRAFPSLAIHEAVYEELVSSQVKSFADLMINENPPRLVIHSDATLTPEEKVLRDTIEEFIYPFTKYEPLLDNRDDRGEVKSLAFLATKGLPYFAARDSNVIKLIENSQKWSTRLDNIQAIKMHEVIFFLSSREVGKRKNLRNLYRYLYRLTKSEKGNNPEWGQFIAGMDKLYKPA